jgi:hypothetical protein
MESNKYQIQVVSFFDSISIQIKQQKKSFEFKNDCFKCDAAAGGNAKKRQFHKFLNNYLHSKQYLSINILVLDIEIQFFRIDILKSAKI